MRGFGAYVGPLHVAGGVPVIHITSCLASLSEFNPPHAAQQRGDLGSSSSSSGRRLCGGCSHGAGMSSMHTCQE
jgi:hypothetical protein